MTVEKKTCSRKKKETSDIKIEEGFSDLNALLKQMESEDTTLEESFELYKRGVDIIKLLNDKLDLVEKKILEIEQS